METEEAPASPAFSDLCAKHRQLHDVQAGVVGLLLTRVGDLRHGRHLPVAGFTNATVVAVTHGKNAAIRPDSTTQGGLLCHLHMLVEVDPATST